MFKFIILGILLAGSLSGFAQNNADSDDDDDDKNNANTNSENSATEGESGTNSTNSTNSNGNNAVLPEPEPLPAPAPVQVQTEVPPPPDPAKENFENFRRHYTSVLGGHSEGVYIVKAANCPVHIGPDSKFEVANKLNHNDEVHAVDRINGWIKIGYSQYVEEKNLRSLGLRTRGLKPYDQMPDQPTSVPAAIQAIQSMPAAPVKQTPAVVQPTDDPMGNDAF